MMTARLATLALLFSQVGHEIISIFILCSNRIVFGFTPLNSRTAAIGINECNGDFSPSAPSHVRKYSDGQPSRHARWLL